MTRIATLVSVSQESRHQFVLVDDVHSHLRTLDSLAHRRVRDDEDSLIRELSLLENVADVLASVGDELLTSRSWIRRDNPMLLNDNRR